MTRVEGGGTIILHCHRNSDIFLSAVFQTPNNVKKSSLSLRVLHLFHLLNLQEMGVEEIR